MYYKSISLIKYDMVANKGNLKAQLIISFFRISNYFSQRRNNLFFLMIGLPIRILYKFIIEWILAVEIPASVKIGKGFKLHHGQGLVLNSRVEIGENVTLKHNTTIGAKTDLNDKFISAPKIGNNVIVHPHSVIMANVEDNVIIGAGSIVTKTIYSYSIVAGNPAKLLKKLEHK